MISRFFIHRPVFAAVLSILITLAGVVAIVELPVAQYPSIVPPTIQITATYPGADAQTVARSVAEPIEEQLSGATNLLYFQSESSNSGACTIVATFAIGTDQDLAAVEVQNRIAIAQPRLPEEVVRQGLTIKKSSTNILCVVSLESHDPRYDDVYLSNYANINLLDALKRVPGVGDASVFGTKDYAMRVWLNPDRMAQKKLTVDDVAAAIRDQNAVFPAGTLGARPGPPTPLTVPVLTRGRLDKPQEYDNIILRARPDGSLLRVKDVGHSELGSQSYDQFGRLNGRPTAIVLIYLQPGANALSVITGVKDRMKELATSLPSGVSYGIPYDSTKFIRISIEEVVITLAEAVALVLAVVFVFLQSWRATLIPLLAVPVAIVGTFAGMYALGFSINTLTMFGLVLAIGIVVDDAIVVVENVERLMHDEKLPPKQATLKAMQQVTGPVIAVVLVLCAVFVPVAFLGGLTGQLYRQFAVTIAVSVTISGLVALTLSPALCAILLKPGDHKKPWFFRLFDWAFGWMTRGYTGGVRLTLRHAFLSVVVYAVLGFAVYHFIRTVPTGFIPDEDQGYVICAIIMPEGSSLDRTNRVLTQVEKFFESQPEVANVTTLGGFDFLSGGSSSTSSALIFVPLKDWSDRQAPGQSAQDLVNAAWAHFSKIRDGIVLTFNPPAIQGLGARAGFQLELQARGSDDVAQLAKVSNDYIARVQKRGDTAGLNSTLRVTVPELFVDVDREKAKVTGLPLSEIFNTLQACMGSLYVNDFDKFGRVWRVQIQAEPQFRRTPQDVRRVYVRNDAGQMLPLSSVVHTRFTAGPNIVTHFNGYPAVQITGTPAPGFSTGQAMETLRNVAKGLPTGYDIAWSGASYQEAQAGAQAPIVLMFGLVVVFLVLAAQYEKWSLPIAVLLAVPIGVLGALVAIWLRGLSQDTYFQIGLLTLVGLTAKNAILIIEFCIVLRRSGHSLHDSAMEAARLRFRPIVMTSLAFILGAVPLAISTGAGAGARHSIGTGVIGGMIAATALAIFFVPLFFVVIERIAEMRSPHHPPAEADSAEPAEATIGPS